MDKDNQGFSYAESVTSDSEQESEIENRQNESNSNNSSDAEKIQGSSSAESVTSDSEASSSDESVVVPTRDSTGKAFYRQRITLYHYTTRSGARSIEEDQKIRQNIAVGGRRRHNMHGEGVYFTSWDPGRRSKRDLIANLFVSSGIHLRNESFFHDRILCIVRVEFDEDDPIVKLNDGGRDLFVHRGDVNIRNYQGRYRIYDNPNAP